MSDLDLFPDRETLLGGPPGKRAEALLFVIERRTAQVVRRAQQQLRRLGATADSGEEDMTFFAAFGAGDGQRPSIQQLERCASRWADLVPHNARLQAAIAHAMAERHEFTHGAVPGLRAALGLDDPSVRGAFERMYGQPLDTIYTDRVPVVQRLRWGWTGVVRRLDALPPFWTAYSLTLTETVGATILALPIAFAGVGPIAGLVVLVTIGLINTLTAAYMAEAVTRSGPMRYGGSYLGRLLHDLLGPSASSVVSAVMLSLCLLLLPTYYIGVASTLAAATSVPAAVWVAVIFGVNLFFLRRGLGATVAGALLVGAVNIGIVVALMGVTLPHLRGDLLMGGSIPLLDGNGFDTAIVGLVFGVGLSAFCGHTSAVLGGQLVLPRDPSGRSLVRGTAAASLTAIGLYALFVVTVNGAVPGDVLAAETGTVLPPLADAVGPIVLALGTVFVILALGMGSIHYAVALFSVVSERLPAVVAPTFSLPARTGRVVLRPRRWRTSDVSIVLSYRGLQRGVGIVRVEIDAGGVVRREDLPLSGRWELSAADALWPEGADRDVVNSCVLALEPVAADDAGVRFRLTTTMHVGVDAQWTAAGKDVSAQLLGSSGDLISWMLRQGPVDAATVAAERGMSVDAAITLLDELVQHSELTEHIVDGTVHYTPRLTARSRRHADGTVWAALDDDGTDAKAAAGAVPMASRQAGGWLGQRGRFLIAASPVATAFVVTEWMVLTGSGSFAGMLGFIGVLVVPLLSGVLPVLLVVAARRRGLPARGNVVRSPAMLWLTITVYVVFVGSIVLHGLVIWDDPLQRTGAMVAAVAMVAFSAMLLRNGALRRRLTLEVRADSRGGARTQYRVALGGEPVVATVTVDDGKGGQERTGSDGVLPDLDRIQRLGVTIASDARVNPGEINVWVHRVGVNGASAGVAAIADIGAGRHRSRGRLRPLTGEYLAAVDGPAGAILLGVELEERGG